MKRLVPMFACLILSAGSLHADTHYVATNGLHVAPYTNSSYAATNIRSAIAMASSGDTVLVTNGIYKGVGNRDISITNRITVRSVNGPAVTIVDCETNGFGFYVNVEAGGPTNPILDGFTVIRGTAFRGGGIFCETGVLIEDCMFVSNSADQAGGIWIDEHSVGTVVRRCTIAGNTGRGVECVSPNALLEYCVISNNTTMWDPAGIMFGGASCATLRCSRVVNNWGSTSSSAGGIGVGWGSSPHIENCVIANNEALGLGGGFVSYGGQWTIVNCTVVNNSGTAGGLYRYNSGSDITILNSIFWNVGSEFGGKSATMSVNHSCIEGGFAGSSNTPANPNLTASLELVLPG